MTGRSAFVLYAGEEISVSAIGDSLSVVGDDGKERNTDLLPAVETLIAEREVAIAEEKETEKQADRAKLAVLTDEALASKLLPDSLYSVPALYSIRPGKSGYIGTVHDETLRNQVATMKQKGGNRESTLRR